MYIYTSLYLSCLTLARSLGDVLLAEQHHTMHIIISDVYIHNDQQPYLGESAILPEFCPYGEQGSVSPSFDVVFLQSVSECASFRHEGTVRGKSSETPYWIPLIHRDIKACKVLVRSLGSEDNLSSTRIVLSDSGLAEYYRPGTKEEKYVIGTTEYWAPELTYWKMEFTPASDVWAVGAVMYLLAHVFVPVEYIQTTRNG